jgi:hypothetical protein
MYAVRAAALIAGAAGVAMFAAGLWRLIGSRHRQPGTSAVRVRADAGGLTLAAEGVEHQLYWSCFTAVSETPNLFVLHQGPHLCRYIPRRALGTGPGASSFRRLLAASLQDTDPSLWQIVA